MNIIPFPVRKDSPARPDSRRLYAALLIADPDAVHWALEQMMPELLAEEPLPGETSDREVDARIEATWDILGDLLHEWLDAHGLAVPVDPAPAVLAEVEVEVLGGAA